MKKKKVIVLALTTALFLFSIKILNGIIANQFIKPNDFYQVSYDYSQSGNIWSEDANNDSLTQTTLLNLLAQLKKGEYDEFRTNFIDCYKTIFDKDNCYLIFRRVFVNNADLTLIEKDVLLEVLNEIIEIDKQLNNNLAIIKNYSLQQEILYHSGRIVSAYKIETKKEMFS